MVTRIIPVQQNVQVNQNGEATIQYTAPSSLVGRNSQIRAKYNQNNNYNNATGTANITVIYPTEIVGIPAYYDISDGQTVTITGTLYNPVLEAPITEGTLLLKRGDTLLDSSSIDNQGQFTLEYSPQILIDIFTDTTRITEETVQVIYQGFYHQSVTKNVKMAVEHSIGVDTNTPFTNDMKYKGELQTSGTHIGTIFINYTCNPMILTGISFEGDFTFTVKTFMDCLQSFGHCGFTTSQNSLNTEIKINQNNVNDTIPISNIYTQSFKEEIITIERMGNEYTVTHNEDEVTTTVGNPSTVYFYMYKTGNCSSVVKSISYTEY